MAIDLNTAKSLIQQRGIQPPTGVQPGTPQYDQWAQQWLQNAVNAGTPWAIQAAGGDAAIGGGQAEGQGGHVADWQNAAPYSEWMGKRKPTVQELRRWAHDTGRSEDYARYSDAAVNGWIQRNWDVGKGTFLNNYGDAVDKPDERGPNTPAGVNGTGDAGNYGAGAGGGGNQAAAPTTGNAQAALDNPLQAQLYQLFANKATGAPNAQSLAQGGVWSYGNQPAAPAPAPAAPKPQPAAQSPQAAAAQAWSPQNLTSTIGNLTGGNTGFTGGTGGMMLGGALANQFQAAPQVQTTQALSGALAKKFPGGTAGTWWNTRTNRV